MSWSRLFRSNLCVTKQCIGVTGSLVADKKYQYTRTDLDTGELKRWNGSPGATDKPITGQPFLMSYQEAQRAIATNYDLQGFDLRVYIFLTGILDNENWIDVHHGRIARQMSTDDHEVKRPAVSRSIKHLTERAIILKGSERTYRLNPGVGWKGNRQSQSEAQKQAVAGKLSLVRP